MTITTIRETKQGKWEVTVFWGCGMGRSERKQEFASFKDAYSNALAEGYEIQIDWTPDWMTADIAAAKAEMEAKKTKASLTFAKWGFWVTVCVVILTIAGLGIAVATWWGSDESTQKATKQTEQVIGGLTDVKSAIVSQGQSSTQVIGGLSDMKAAIVTQLEEHIRKLQVQGTPKKDGQ